MKRGIARKIKIWTLDTIDWFLENKNINKLYESVSCTRIGSWMLRLVDSFFFFPCSLVLLGGFSIGIVMDGHRRYAKRKDMTKKEGHIAGLKKMLEFLRTLNRLNCKHVVFFAFGKKNYKRSPEEVEDLHNIMHDTISRKMEKKENEDIINMTQVIGDTSTMTESLAKQVKLLNQENKNGKKVSILFSYSGIEQYIRNKTDGLTVPVDIIVRTSGEKRLSDFLLCNASTRSTLVFPQVKWPLFSKFHMFLVLLKHRIEKTLE